MTVDPSVIPGLLFLLAELAALAGVGYVIVRVALRETDQRVALAQGLVVGPAIWGIVVNLIMYVLPGIAGAIAGWVFVLTLAAVLMWRSPKPVRPRLRTAGIFSLAVLALFWFALVGRQTIGITDPPMHLGLAASIRAGLFPPEFPWTPGAPAYFHYGFDLLTGLLAPPAGLDSAFVEELLSAYVWICLALVVAAMLLRRAAGFTGLIILMPLLLTASASVYYGGSFSIVSAVIPTGIPAAGIRSSLTDIYWPSLETADASLYYMLPNIFKPPYTLSYALTLAVLAHSRRRSWISMVTLAALVGFIGLLSTALVPAVFVMWAVLEAVSLIESGRAGSTRWSDMVRLASGFALAALLLLAGSFSSILTGDDLTLAWNESRANWRLLGIIERLPGGVGLIGFGPLAVAGVAALLARRDRVVLALAAGSGMLVLITLLTDYEPNSTTIGRFHGHARNLALLAFMLALGIRIAGLRLVQWRYAAGAAVVALVTWPTVAAVGRYAGSAISHNSIELANARPMQTATRFGQRHAHEKLPSERIAAYIRGNAAVDARVFSPSPHQITYATGRPNASGFAGLVHGLPADGTVYRDVLDHLEPAAVQRRGFEYIHAPDEWVDGLPEEAVDRLTNPRLFQLVVRDESESLYRVLPAFLSLDTPPAPASYEALRRAIPASATVYLLRPDDFDPRPLTRTAWALSHTRLLGHVGRTVLHLVTPVQTEPLGNHVPDLIIAPAGFSPWMFPAASRQPIWWNDETAVYALDGAVEPIMPPPPWAQPFPFSVQVSDQTQSDGRIAFTATFEDRAPDQWSGQDWVLVATEGRPWDIPTQLLPNGTPAIAIWFDGYLDPGGGTRSFGYEFDFHSHSLAVRRERGELRPLDRSEGVLESGGYLLAVRLRHEYKPNHWRDAAIIPVLRITVSETGEVSYEVHEDVRSG